MFYSNSGANLKLSVVYILTHFLLDLKLAILRKVCYCITPVDQRGILPLFMSISDLVLRKSLLLGNCVVLCCVVL